MKDVRYDGWRKSRRSNSSANCIEVAAADHLVAVRDSKQHGDGPILEFTSAAWETFTSAVRIGEPASGCATADGIPA
jgi:hypothetical protein